MIASIIAGQAYGRRATLEVSHDTLTWRAHRGSLPATPENIVTTVHDVRDVRWIEQSWSLSGGILAVLAFVWFYTEGALWGAITLVIAAALLVYRRMRPRLFLALELADRRLVLKVAVTSASDARVLVERIEHALATGELPPSPPKLP
ncbi:MAG TPA: hypothetical protein VNO30_40895 [Kofleriaceae bacterium]|nr:hypothetical protein [Kofleriaceae bacterium]